MFLLSHSYRAIKLTWLLSSVNQHEPHTLTTVIHATPLPPCWRQHPSLPPASTSALLLSLARCHPSPWATCNKSVESEGHWLVYCYKPSRDDSNCMSGWARCLVVPTGALCSLGKRSAALLPQTSNSFIFLSTYFTYSSLFFLIVILRCFTSIMEVGKLKFYKERHLKYHLNVNIRAENLAQ